MTLLLQDFLGEWYNLYAFPARGDAGLDYSIKKEITEIIRSESP